MNSNTLRIRGSEKNPTRGAIITFDPVILPDNYNFKNIELCNKFLQSKSEDQLVILKQILYSIKGHCESDIVKFLTVTYLNADVKHPVKCMITRYVTKNNSIQKQFSEILTHEIKSLIYKPHTKYKCYLDAVWKIGSCAENFPPGGDAMKNLEIPLVGYFKDCLLCCISTLSEANPLSPTEKNEIFNLAHSALRLLLYLVQRVNADSIAKLIPMLDDIRAGLRYIMFDSEAPMDTKSICGILYVSLHVIENKSDSWIDILDREICCNSAKELLENESAKLSLYSALATMIPMSKLQAQLVNGIPAIITLTNNILDIGERCSAESTFILGVTRTLLQICKGLEHTGALGLRLLDGLLVFVWAHLEHHTDSVQHLTAQALAHIVKYCAKLQRDGSPEAMENLLVTLSSLDRSRKSFYIGLVALSVELGADRVLATWPRIVEELVAALAVQAVQASATTALESLLRQHARKASSDVIHQLWIQPVVRHVARSSLDSAQHHILENLLSLAVKLDNGVMNHIIPYMKEVCERDTRLLYRDIKCVLMLLTVVRAAGELPLLAAAPGDSWKDIISYDVLKMAAVDSSQEIRILSISLIVESPKSTEVFARGELDFVLWFIKYNVNHQTPHFRQLVLSTVKKFIKRLENSYKVLTRGNDSNTKHNKDDYYLNFVEQLGTLCFDSLIVGANYSRRHVALQILVWLESIQLRTSNRIWKEDEVEILLRHLSDSYDINKALALELLVRCPVELIKTKKYATSLELKDILEEASSVKPTACVSAVYKLRLLTRKLPQNIIQGTESTIPNKVKFALLNILVDAVQQQLAVCQQSLVLGAKRAPLYGLLHCVGAALDPISPFGIPLQEFTGTIRTLVRTCADVCASVGAVLSSAAPEGLLPYGDTCDSASGRIRLEDGGEVTAQMVLLCAWRSVKEVSLILSTIVSQALAHDEFEPAPLRIGLVRSVGQQFTALLTETKHRGAFEQVYVGFTRLLNSLWRSPNPELNELPKVWLEELMSAIESGDGNGKLCSTRRSAGLPFMIQALVITELQVKVSSASFGACARALLRLAREAADAHTRCHCLNVLRALYRSSQLDEIVGAFVGDGLLVALRAFDSCSWIERNSATLLFSSLMVRIFGVQRSRDSERLCVRNRMTGRIFFLRYPQLYDFMLDKLKEVSEDEEQQVLRPALFPILLLLARLYPSSLEGTVSNLKLATFVPHVCCSGRSAVLHARRLAANAAPPLIPPHFFVSHVEGVLNLLCDKNIKKNFCHGLLLQLLKLLDTRSESVTMDPDVELRLSQLFRRTAWILEQALTGVACYVIADEYIRVLNVLMWRFEKLLDKTYVKEIQRDLNNLLFNGHRAKINPGRELCLANAAYLNLITLHKYDKKDRMRVFLYDCLSHDTYEVVLAAMNYLLILYGELEIENAFQEHIKEISDNNVLDLVRTDPKYVQTLCEVLKSCKYLECTQKCLRLLTLEPDTQKEIIKAKDDVTDISDDVMDRLFGYVENEHGNLTHIFLASLCDFLTRHLEELSNLRVLDALRVVFACSLSDNSVETRVVVVEFVEKNLKRLLELDLEVLNEGDQFEFKATVWATMVVLLEDDEDAVRERAALAVGGQSPHRALPTRAAELLLQRLQGDQLAVPLLALVALLDFKAEVCMTDEINDECRVFDSNERYNINLEETIWTRACANCIKTICTDDVNGHVYSAVTDGDRWRTFEKLCDYNFTAYKILIEGGDISKIDVNPKIQIFYNTLHS